MRATSFLAILFIVIAGATLLGAAVLAGAASGGLIAANPTLRAALGLGWMLGLWASFAVFLTFLTAWLVEELKEQPAAVSEESRQLRVGEPLTPAA
jgi:predicted membrane-bound dolichyl-phosphate-mannose-protein mannosyltransferase